ncbi:hypothetical protein C8F04DRAFT_1175476 [Mycena alexandri]|uniref:Uncharacterized protein n=1 Tax=Mycena alexandri TaxID=1745969 RepID=A0AAD6XFV8_9AGAR|nr:hypothetical protein C8F04DRAFT_1175476 [Mycena alexandri]
MDPPPTVSAPEPANPNGNDSIWPRRTSKLPVEIGMFQLQVSAQINSQIKILNTLSAGARNCDARGNDLAAAAPGRASNAWTAAIRAAVHGHDAKDGNGGCNRCEERDLECTADQQQPIVHPPAPVPVGPTSPERVRTACQNCRNDNKKVGRPLLVIRTGLTKLRDSAITSVLARGVFPARRHVFRFRVVPSRPKPAARVAGSATYSVKTLDLARIVLPQGRSALISLDRDAAVELE